MGKPKMKLRGEKKIRARLDNALKADFSGVTEYEANLIADDMQQNVPIDTGYLHSRISVKDASRSKTKMRFEIVADTLYSLYAERYQPYFFPALRRARSRFSSGKVFDPVLRRSDIYR